VPAILGLVHELAVYEKEPDAVEATEIDFREALFPRNCPPTAFAHVAVEDGTVVGMAIWYVTFSTWLGCGGIWLEDLFVSPEHRGSGLGKGLLATAGGGVRRAWLRPARVVGTEMEHPLNRLLRLDRRAADG